MYLILLYLHNSVGIHHLYACCWSVFPGQRAFQARWANNKASGDKMKDNTTTISAHQKDSSSVGLLSWPLIFLAKYLFRTTDSIVASIDDDKFLPFVCSALYLHGSISRCSLSLTLLPHKQKHKTYFV